MEMRLMEMPSMRVAAVAGPMAASKDVHPVHQKFVATLLQDAPRALAFEGVRAPSGNVVRTGALVYGDYSKPEPVMSMFKQCLFVEQGMVAVRESKLSTFAKAVDPEVTIEDTPPGRYAVYTHVGPYAELSSALRLAMYRSLPEMGLQHAGGPILEFYRGPDSEGRPVTDVAVPVTQR